MTDQPWRLLDGGHIDRSRTLRFTFDGKFMEGHPGDTLASALLANGTRLVARSFKYHRPRGIFSAGVEEPNALVELRGGDRQEPNTLSLHHQDERRRHQGHRRSVCHLALPNSSGPCVKGR